MKSELINIKRGKWLIIGLLSLAVSLLIGWGVWLTGVFSIVAQQANQETLSTVIAPTPERSVSDRLPGVVGAINTYRALHDLPALKLDADLNDAAQAKAGDLVAHQYWAHERPGKTPWDFFDASGYDYRTAGENLAKCFSDNDILVKAWIASPAHRAVLLGDYRDVGLGVATNERDGCAYVAGHFGSRL